MNNVFGKLLKIRISQLGLSQAGFAKKSKLTEACISQVITGKRDPSLSTVIKILKASSLKFEELTKE